MLTIRLSLVISLRPSHHELTQVIITMSQSLKIPQATKQGYIEIEPGGAFDWSYPTSLTRRGRVQMGGVVSPTITCNPESIYVYEGCEVCRTD